MAELPTAESIAPAPRVLVVDDSRDILEPLAEYLGAQGLDVVTAADGMGMRRQLAAGPVDLVVLDVMLPCLLYTSPSPRDKRQSRMPSSA